MIPYQFQFLLYTLPKKGVLISLSVPLVYDHGLEDASLLLN
jgi:hypothetical protein